MRLMKQLFTERNHLVGLFDFFSDDFLGFPEALDRSIDLGSKHESNPNIFSQ